jgi:acetyl esterase/lipase
MEVRNWTYEAFPEWTELPEGAKSIPVTGDEPGTYYVPDVEYACPDGIPLHLQILLPVSRKEPEKSCPCIVYVQGSGWMEQDCYHSVGRIARLADRGYVIAVVQYRHSGQAGFPAQIQDARNAVRFMRKNAETWHVIPDQIFLAGSSSGGHTAVFAALAGPEDCTENGLLFPGAEPQANREAEADVPAEDTEARLSETGGGARVLFDRNQYPGVSAGVRGVIDLYGCVSVRREDDFPTMYPRWQEGGMDTAFLSHIPEPERPSLLERATAVNWINENTKLPPVFIAHGTKDRVVNTRQSVELYQTLRKYGVPCELYLLVGADHGGPEFWMEELVDQEVRFLRKITER